MFGHGRNSKKPQFLLFLPHTEDEHSFGFFSPSEHSTWEHSASNTVTFLDALS